MRTKRKIPQINSSSSADIAFLLLIFFLLTTSLEKEKSFSRSLPNDTPKTEKEKEIKERDVFEITVNGDNTLIYRDEEIDPQDLKSAAKLFISNPYDNIDLPEKFTTAVPEFGERRITKNHLFLLQISRSARYQTYINVQNMINAAYNELRNEFAIQNTGKRYAALTPEQQEAIMQVYPYKMSEVELKREQEP